jgi:hypothetical protein
MIRRGTQIINEKTNTIHIVDEIEVINNETLVFTQDVKCFPLSEVKKYPNLEKISSEDDESLILSVIKSCNNFPVMKENYQEILENVFKDYDMNKKNPPKKNILQKIYHFFK